MTWRTVIIETSDNIKIYLYNIFVYSVFDMFYSVIRIHNVCKSKKNTEKIAFKSLVPS